MRSDDDRPAAAPGAARVRGWRIRTLEQRDAGCLQQFISSQMERNQMGVAPSAAHFRWKYFSRLPCFCFGAFDVRDELVGVLGRVTRPFQLGGREVITTEATDAFVAPAFQGKGLFQRLIVHARRAVAANGVAFSSARPNQNSRPGALHAGHRQLCELQLSVRPLTTHYLLSRLTNREAVPVAGHADQLRQLSASWVGRLGQMFHRLDFSEVDSFDERVDALWRASDPQAVASVVKDRAYMNWRYVDCPNLYQRYVLQSSERLLGVAVTRLTLSEDGTLAAELADFVTGAEDRGHLAFLLLGHTMLQMVRHGAQLMRCFLASGLSVRQDPLRAALRLHGFVRRPAADSALLIRSESDRQSTELLQERGNWRFRAGDLDSI